MLTCISSLHPFLTHAHIHTHTHLGAKSWVKELQRRGDPSVIIALAGNKADLGSRRKVDLKEAQDYAAENGLLHMETSGRCV